MTFETFNQRDERTWPEQQKYNDKDKYKDKDKDNDKLSLKMTKTMQFSTASQHCLSLIEKSTPHDVMNNQKTMKKTKTKTKTRQFLTAPCSIWWPTWCWLHPLMERGWFLFWYIIHYMRSFISTSQLNFMYMSLFIHFVCLTWILNDPNSNYIAS